MSTLSPVQIAKYARAAGFSGSGLVISIAVALAESGGNPSAQGINRNSAGQITSVDRGLWQINSVYHREVTDGCAYNPSCSAGAAFKISGGGSNWTPWSTYTSGRYRAFTAQANSAATSIGAGGSTPSQVQPSPPVSPSAALTGMPSTQILTFGAPPQVSGETLSQQAAAESSAFWGPFQTLVALGFMFGILYAISRFGAGRVAIYYGELLILLFLFATQAQYFREGLLPFLGKQPNEHPSASAVDLTPQPLNPTVTTTL